MTYAVITGQWKYDLELQIVVETETLAKREVRDLKKMGCEDARFRKFDSEEALYAWVERGQ